MMHKHKTLQIPIELWEWVEAKAKEEDRKPHGFIIRLIKQAKEASELIYTYEKKLNNVQK